MGRGRGGRGASRQSPGRSATNCRPACAPSTPACRVPWTCRRRPGRQPGLGACGTGLFAFRPRTPASIRRGELVGCRSSARQLSHARDPRRAGRVGIADSHQAGGTPVRAHGLGRGARGHQGRGGPVEHGPRGGTRVRSPHVACSHCGLPVPAGLFIRGGARAVLRPDGRRNNTRSSASGDSISFYHLVSGGRAHSSRAGHGRSFDDFDDGRLQRRRPRRWARSGGGRGLYLEGVHCAACAAVREAPAALARRRRGPPN